MNRPNWGRDTVLHLHVPVRIDLPVIRLRDTVLDEVEKAIGIKPVDLPGSMMPEKPGRT